MTRYITTIRIHSDEPIMQEIDSDIGNQARQNMHDLDGYLDLTMPILEEEYVDDEVAISEFIKNISDKEVRDSIISDIKEFQIESIRKARKLPFHFPLNIRLGWQGKMRRV